MRAKAIQKGFIAWLEPRLFRRKLLKLLSPTMARFRFSQSLDPSRHLGSSTDSKGFSLPGLPLVPKTQIPFDAKAALPLNEATHLASLSDTEQLLPS